MKPKNEIRSKVEESISHALTELNVVEPSKKTIKLIARTAKKLSSRVKIDVRKQAKRLAKQSKSIQKGGLVTSKKKVAKVA